MDSDKHCMTAEELRGTMALKFHPGKNLNEFCQKHFSNYDPDRFETIAIRVFYGKEIILTLYALDQSRQREFGSAKLPVKKFKTGIFSLAELLNFVDEFNFTLSTGNYNLEEMEVINK